MCPHYVFYYFCVDLKSAHNHAIPVHPSNQLAIRTRVVSVLSLLVWRAKYAGSKITKASNKIATIYFIKTIVCVVIVRNINGEYAFPVFVSQFIYHILQICPVLLQFVPIGYILPFGRYVT